MPSSKNYVRDYVQERKTESKKRMEARNARHRARYAVEKKLGAEAIKGKDVGHKKALSKGGSNSPSNLVLQNPHGNQSFARNKDGSMRSETSKKEAKRKRK